MLNPFNVWQDSPYYQTLEIRPSGDMIYRRYEKYFLGYFSPNTEATSQAEIRGPRRIFCHRLWIVVENDGVHEMCREHQSS